MLRMKVTSRSQRPSRVGVSPQSDTSGGDEKRSLGAPVGTGGVTSSAFRACSSRKGRRATLGYPMVIPGTANNEEDDVNASFCTAKGETSPDTEQPPVASGTKSDLFQSFMEDSGGVGIESPVTFGAVVHSDCPSTLVKKMAGLRIDETHSDTPATVATVAPGGLFSNNAGQQNVVRVMDSLEPSSPAVPQGVCSVKLTFSPKSGGSSVEAPRFMVTDEDGMVAGPTYDSGVKVETGGDRMSPSKHVEVEQCSSSSRRELGQVLNVPSSASFDLRQAAEGDVNVDVDCERSAIFGEMLQTASVANSPDKSVVLSLVEKEAMELAASFVVEVESSAVDGLTNEVSRTVSIKEDCSQEGLTNEESEVGIKKKASKAHSTNQEAQQTVGASQEAPQTGGASQEAPQRGGPNQEVPQKSLKTEEFEGGADGLSQANTGGTVVDAQMRTKLAVGSSATAGAAHAGKSGGNRRASFVPSSSATSRLVKPHRKSIGDISRVPEIAPESTERSEGPVGAGGHASRNRTPFGFGADVGAPRKISRGVSPDAQAQRMQQKMKRAKSEDPREAPEKKTIGQGERKRVTRRDQYSKGHSRRSSHIGNIRRSQYVKVPDGPAVKTVGRFGEKAVSKGLTVPEPFLLSASNRPGSASNSSKSREEYLTFGERMVHMETKVPERFIKRPAGEQLKPAASAPFNPKPTVPKSPNLRTEARAALNKSHVKTPQEREEEDLAYMKKHQFKARRYSSDGFGISGEQGVISKHHSDKPLTKQEPFRLSTGSRSSRNVTSRDDGEISKQIKARSLPGSRSSSAGRGRHGPQDNPELMSIVGPRPLTAAESPMLSTMRRSVLRSSKVGGEKVKSTEQVELEESRANQFKARPMPDYVKSRRQSVNPSDKPVGLAETEPSSHRTEERGKAKSALLEHRRLAQRRQDEAVKKARARTQSSALDLEHFRLSSQVRHERAAREFREKIRREEEETRLASKVTARPLPASTFWPEPYPQKTEVAITQPTEIPMHSSLRAQQRARWDRENEARLEAEKRERLELEAANAAAEKQKITELRRRSIDHGGMAFKAKPIARAPKPAEEPHVSTMAITPGLRTMRRARNEPAQIP